MRPIQSLLLFMSILGSLIAGFADAFSCEANPSKSALAMCQDSEKLMRIIESPNVSEDRLALAIRELGPVTEPLFWNRIATRPVYSLNHRRHAVFQLVHRHMRPGCKLSELDAVLAGAKWVRDDDVQQNGGVFGSSPLRFDQLGTYFRVYILGEPPPYWVIYLQVSGDLTEDDFVAALRGKLAAKQIRDATVLQVAFSPRLEKLYGPPLAPARAVGPCR